MKFFAALPRRSGPRARSPGEGLFSTASCCVYYLNLSNKTSSEEKIFGNLNSKRIPLDGADLVRAVLITRVAKEEGKREADIKNIVRVNERRVKIGWQLDQINNWWSEEN